MCADGGSSSQVEKRGPGEMCRAAAVAMTAVRSSAIRFFSSSTTKGTAVLLSFFFFQRTAGRCGAASAASLLSSLLTVCVHSSAVVVGTATLAVPPRPSVRPRRMRPQFDHPITCLSYASLSCCFLFFFQFKKRIL